MTNRGSNTIFLVGDSVSLEHWNNGLSAARRISFNVETYTPANQYVHVSARIFLGDKANPSQEIQMHMINLGNVNSAGDFDPVKFKDVMHWYLSNSSLVKGKAVIIINMGLHFQVIQPEKHGRIESYQKLLDIFIPIFKDYAEQKHTVLYRETSAQHFDTENGAFSYALLDGHRCSS